MNALRVLTSEIRQFDGLYSLNDLHKASGSAPKHRPNQFMRLDTARALADEIQCADQRSATKAINGGAQRGTYVCKELVYAYAMWISPSFHLKVIRAFDALQQGDAIPGPPSSMFAYDPKQVAGKRFLVRFSEDGTQCHTKPIPSDAYVLTLEQFVRSVGSPNDMPFRTAQLAQIVQGASERLHRILAGPVAR